MGSYSTSGVSMVLVVHVVLGVLVLGWFYYLRGSSGVLVPQKFP